MRCILFIGELGQIFLVEAHPRAQEALHFLYLPQNLTCLFSHVLGLAKIVAEFLVPLQKVHFVLGGVKGLQVVGVLCSPLLFQPVKILLLAIHRHFLVVGVGLPVECVPRFRICGLSCLYFAFDLILQMLIRLLIVVLSLLSELELLSGLFGFEVPLDHNCGLLSLFIEYVVDICGVEFRDKFVLATHCLDSSLDFHALVDLRAGFLFQALEILRHLN